MNHHTLRTSELQVVIGNNEPGDDRHPSHRAGYNGIWSLTSVHDPVNCFVPLYAGLNLEHLMDDLFATEEGGNSMEPRHWPMHLERVGDNVVKLAQVDTPLTHVNSTTVFEVKEPHVVDFSCTIQLTRPPREGKSFGVFWASYINAPLSPALYFLDGEMFWNCLSADKHGDGGFNTVCHQSVDDPSFGRPTGTLPHSISSRRFSLPLMYGRPGDGRMLYLQMFDQAASTRLTMSPRGGGANHEQKCFNPAWDYQMIVNEAEVGVAYTFRSRLIYKPYVDRSEVLDLYHAWDGARPAG